VIGERPRLVVDRLLCDGNGICAGLAPTLLRMNDEDELEVIKDNVEPDERDAVTAAIQACPKAALAIED
jgi:ferredoxin